MELDELPTIEDNISLIDISEIIPYSNNPKSHPEAQVKKIASSIKNYGWDQPIVIDENKEIIKGHGRLQAAELLDLTQVPVIIRTDLSDAEKKASRIADNKTAESEWLDDSLASELEILDDTPDIELEDTGFNTERIDDLLEPDDMEIPEAFDEIDDEEIETEHECPECGYEW